MSFNEKPYLRAIELKRDAIDSFNSYPFSIPSILELDVIEFHEDVTFLRKSGSE